MLTHVAGGPATCAEPSPLGQTLMGPLAMAFDTKLWGPSGMQTYASHLLDQATAHNIAPKLRRKADI